MYGGYVGRLIKWEVHNAKARKGAAVFPNIANIPLTHSVTSLARLQHTVSAILYDFSVKTLMKEFI